MGKSLADMAALIKARNAAREVAVPEPREEESTREQTAPEPSSTTDAGDIRTSELDKRQVLSERGVTEFPAVLHDIAVQVGEITARGGVKARDIQGESIAVTREMAYLVLAMVYGSEKGMEMIGKADAGSWGNGPAKTSKGFFGSVNVTKDLSREDAFVLIFRGRYRGASDPLKMWKDDDHGDLH